MNGTHKMLRAIINGQSSFRQEVVKRFDRLEERLEDDTPTREENVAQLVVN